MYIRVYIKNNYWIYLLCIVSLLYSLPTRLSRLSVSSVRNKSKTDHFHNGSVSRLVTLSDTTLREETGEELSVSFKLKYLY